MSGFPQELIFVVLFGAVLLYQLLRKRPRQPAAPPVEADTAPAAASAAALEALDALRETVGQPTPTPTPTRAAAPRRAAARPMAGAEDGLHRRRFLRNALLGDRRTQQDAIVIAAILRPCHAHRPYGAD